MSAIDAAIIKALVEQSSSRGIPIPVEWRIGNRDGNKILEFTIPKGQILEYYLPVGTRLFLKNNQTMYEGTYDDDADSIIVNHETNVKALLWGVCNGMDMRYKIESNDSEDDGTYIFSVELTMKEGSSEIPLPDNKTTGFFIPNTIDAFPTAIRAVLNHIKDEIDNVKSE